MNYVTIPVITALVIILIELYKIIVNKQEKYMRLVPVVAICLGMIIGVVSYFTIPDLVPASNYLEAIIIGAVSGGAATGTHQIFKQLSTKPEETEEE